MAQMSQFMQSITVLSETMLVLCKIDGKLDRQEKLNKCATKIEQSLKKKLKEDHKNNKRKLNEAKIEPQVDSSISDSSQLAVDIEIERNYINNGKYDVKTNLEKINIKDMAAHSQQKKNKKKVAKQRATIIEENKRDE